MPPMLQEIIKNKAAELNDLKATPDFAEEARGTRDLAESLPPARDFTAAVSTAGGPAATRVIAEVKKASPSKGVIREDFDPVAIACAYEANGAAAVSVLTDERYFMGSLEYLKAIRAEVALPLLRKDFIIDEYQVYEARAAGADAVLLIVAALELEALRELITLASSLGLAPLVEVHGEAEVETALNAGARIIGVNNRDLNTFRTDISTTERLAPMLPEGSVLVTESGINTPADIARLKKAGADAFLIGEALVREPDPGARLRELIG